MTDKPPATELKTTGISIPMSDKDYERRKHEPKQKPIRRDSAHMWPLRPQEQRTKKSGENW